MFQRVLSGQSLLTQLKACKMLVGMPHRGETIRDTK